MESVHCARSHQHLWAFGKQIETHLEAAAKGLWINESFSPVVELLKSHFQTKPGLSFRISCHPADVIGRQKYG